VLLTVASLHYWLKKRSQSRELGQHSQVGILPLPGIVVLSSNEQTHACPAPHPQALSLVSESLQETVAESLGAFGVTLLTSPSP